MGKLLRVDLESQQYQFTTLPDQYQLLGGRGLASKILSQEVSPGCDPLGNENKLILAPGILAGTAVPNSGRISIAAKSPLTGGIKEANAGGSAAQKLARLGIQAVILEGAAPELTTLKIEKQGVTFIASEDLQLIGNNECIETLKGAHGDSVSVVSIGQAGEMLMPAAGVSVTSPDFFPRLAARGGMGAVMGSKKVKAVVIDDSGCANVEPEDAELFKGSVRAFTKGLTSHPLIGGLKQFGTPLLVGMVNEMGAIPTKNFSQGQFDKAENISGEKLTELTTSRPNGQNSHRCMHGCVIECSNIHTDEQGNTLVSGLEYETIALMGSNCMIDDLDTIAKMNGICNDFGLDTMDVGGALAMAMEAGVIPWGDGEKALELIKEVAKGTENGKLIGSGCKITGESLGVKRIPHVKGQCLSGYDPRVLKGTGVTYATSPMGADHTCGNALPSPANPDYNPSAGEGQAPVSQFLQRYFAAIDSLGLCLFAALPPLDMPDLIKELINCTGSHLGQSLGENYLMELGAMVLSEEKQFNTDAGLGQDSDRLPEFFSKEPLSPGGGTFDVSTEELDSVHN